MGRMILSLSIIIGGLIIGQIVHLAVKKEQPRAISDRYMSTIRDIIVFYVTPIILLGAFWTVDLRNTALISLPFILVLSLLFGAGLALLYSKIAKHDKSKTGAFFCCGSATNVGSFGGLLTFAFLGEQGYAFCVLFFIFGAPFMYAFVFPISSYFSDAKSKQGIFKALITDKAIIIFFIVLAAGFLLNFLNVKRPALYHTINEYLIPVSSFFLVAALGYTMRFSKIRKYLKEIAVITIIKYVLTPCLIIGLAYLFGLHLYADGTLFKALVIMSFLPVGFNALIPINIYGLHRDLGNSCWIISTLSLIVVVPVVYLVLF